MSRTVLVTGGSSGIGRATALLAASKGYAVAVQYRTQQAEARRVVERIRADGGQAIAVLADLRHSEQVEHLYATVERELGRLDAVVNSAGVSRKGKVVDTDPKLLESLLATNVTGLILSCREATKRMSRAHGGEGGVIVNLSSMAATTGGRPGSSVYAASKAAVDAFTLGFAKEVASEGIRVVSVRPGMVDTEMTRDALAHADFAATVAASIPLGRVARAEEIAAPILFLLSDEASFITGTCIDVSGGGFHIGR